LAAQSPSTVLKVLYGEEANMTLYYVFMFLWVRLVGASASELWMRMPSVLFAVAGLYGLYRLGTRLNGRSTGLLAAGLAAPVMDMELITLEYPDAGTLLADLRRSGQTSARADRPRGLAGRAFAERLRRTLGDKPKATFEVVYGHAWRSPAQDVKTVRVFKNIS